jgi:hypothetical protein
VANVRVGKLYRGLQQGPLHPYKRIFSDKVVGVGDPEKERPDPDHRPMWW